MKIILVGGFLGSGKTSLILQLADCIRRQKNAGSVAILENEVGQAGIDDELLRSNGYKVRTVSSGCICCSMAGELVRNIQILCSDYDPKWLILETTGLAKPQKVVENIKEHMPETPVFLVCVADGERWLRLQRAMPEFVEDQLKDADMVLINKADRMDGSQLAMVTQQIKKLCKDGQLEVVSAIQGVPDSVWEKII